MMDLIQEYIVKLNKVEERLASAASDGNTIYPDLSLLAAEVKQQSESFGQIVSMTFDCTFIFNKDCVFSYASQSGAQLLGFDPKNMVGKNWRELSLPRDMMIPLEAHLKTVFKLGTPLTKTAEVQLPGGQRYLEFHLTPIFNKNGAVAEAVACVVRDIKNQYITDTVQQQLTKEYLYEAERLQQLIDNAPTAIIAVNQDGYVTDINAAALSLLPQIKDKRLNLGQYDQPADNNNEELDIIVRTLEGETVTAHYLQKDNQHFLVNSFPSRNQADGTIQGAVVFFQDITEQERLRQELHWLDRVNLIGAMAAGVAHEIRNPLTVVKGYIQMMLHKAKPDNIEQFQIVLEEIDRISTIVTDFLSLARNRVTEKTGYSLNQILMGLYPLMQAEAHKFGVDLQINTDPAVPDCLLAEKEVSQLVLNLYRNSLEAMEDKHGRIVIETVAKENGVELIVEDNGPGIAKENLGRVFDPFFTTKPNGTGLGLSVCLSIVERHSGQIKVEAREKGGTVVKVFFPIS